MTLNEVVNEVCEALNLTSDEAKSRIMREVNRRYRRVTSSIGLATSRRQDVPINAVVGNRFITISDIEKLYAILDPVTDPNRDIILQEVSKDELELLPVKEEPARHYAVTETSARSVIIKLDCVPDTTFSLTADALVLVDTIAGHNEPNFPESFHDLLVMGAMADEYLKMEKVPLAAKCEADFEKRSSDLRMFLAVNGYTDTYQAKLRARAFPWMQNATSTWDN